MNQIVSIIVPIYNVEKYLDKCIYSLINQTYHDIEIILVDDGSTDYSGAICDNWKEKDSRIRVIHKVNGGLSDARNIGIINSNGEYVCFIDSDDWIESETIERAVQAIQKSNLVVWSYYSDSVDERENVVSSTLHLHQGVCDKIDGYRDFENPEIMGIAGYAWNKLYKKSLLNTLRFEVGISLVEDVLFNVPYMCQCEHIIFIDFPGSHYIHRNRSTLGTKYYPDYLNLKIRCAKEKEKLLKAYGASDENTKYFLGKEYIAVYRSSIRIISNQKWPYWERRKACFELIRSREAKEILGTAKVRNCSDRIVILFSKIKFVDLLLMLSRKR